MRTGSTRDESAHGDGPASIDEDLVVERVDELGKDSKSGGDLEESSKGWKVVSWTC